MTLEELISRAEEAKKLSNLLAYLSELELEQMTLRHSNGNYVTEEIARPIIQCGIAAEIKRVTSQLECILKAGEE